MLKIIAVISLMLVGSTLWAASLSCDSCGSECASACGTRHFRSCCFNYLRKKRGPDNLKMLFHNKHKWNPVSVETNKQTATVVEDEPWNVMSNDYKLYPFEDTVENRLRAIYDE